MNAALALDGLDADGADVVRELCAQIVDVVEANEFDAGHHRRERLAILLLVRRCDRAHGAAVEAVLDREKLCADALAFGAQKSGVGASQLQRGLPGFGAASCRRRRGPGR